MNTKNLTSHTTEELVTIYNGLNHGTNFDILTKNDIISILKFREARFYYNEDVIVLETGCTPNKHIGIHGEYIAENERSVWQILQEHLSPDQLIGYCKGVAIVALVNNFNLIQLKKDFQKEIDDSR